MIVIIMKTHPIDFEAWINYLEKINLSLREFLLFIIVTIGINSSINFNLDSTITIAIASAFNRINFTLMAHFYFS